MFSTVAAKPAGLVASAKRPVAPDRRAKPVACPRASADSEKARSVVSRPEDTNKIALSRRDALLAILVAPAEVLENRSVQQSNHLPRELV